MILFYYQEEAGVPPVLALREGSYLHVEDSKMTLGGGFAALLFKGTGAPKSYDDKSDLSFLLEE